MYGTTETGGASGNGTVFKIDAAGTLTTLHSFTGTDGARPSAGLIQARDGSFYGTATFGGADGAGTVFKIDAAGTLTTLHSFASSGTLPYAGLIQASDGSLYGTTSSGGVSGNGTMFKVDAAGTLRTLHHFTGSDGTEPLAGLIQARDGSFYGTTYRGGASGSGTVFRVDAAGKLTTLHSFGGSDGALPEGGLIQASDGSFYGTTLAGGASGLGTVFKIDTTGALTTLHSFAGGTDGHSPYAGLIQGSDGSFYGTTFVGGADGFHGRVFKIDAAGTLTTLHSFSGSDGTHPRAGLIQASDGSLYGTTIRGGVSSDCGTVFKMDTAGTLNTVHTFAGDGCNPAAGLIQASDGNFYGTTYYGGAGGFLYGTVFKVDAAGTLTTIHSFSGSDGANPRASLVQARDGSLYGTTEKGGTADAGVLFRLCTAPTASITSLSPPSMPAGNAAFVLTVNGSNFLTSSVVLWNGSARTTTFVSGTQLTASIPASDIATPGTASVAVSSPCISSASSFEVTLPPANRLALNTGGTGTTSTGGTAANVSSGYATATVDSGVTPYGTAVFSLSQNDVVVSEAGVPASPPTRSARIFIDYRTGVPAGVGTLDIYTGLAIAHRGNSPAAITYTLRDRNAQIVATGQGSLAVGAHFAKFIHELRDVAPDFNLSASFPAATRFGSLEIASSQPVSVVALRLTTNQRGETLLTSTPIADLSASLTNSPVYFPQLADGGGYTTTLILLNTSNGTESGTLAAFDDNGTPLTLRDSGGNSGSAFPYSIPAGGAFVFQTDGSPAAPRVGWVKLTPNPGNSAPVGAGVFSYSPAGILVTESGIPSAIPTTDARIYVDKSGGHDTGLAIANPGGSAGSIVLQAFQNNGSTAAGNGQAVLSIPSGGHSAKFVGQLIGGLPDGFTGVVRISSPTPFVALTLRSLVNGRGDFLLTTFPIADANRPAPAPIVFPEIADGGGYNTQFIFISATGPATITVNFLGDDGSPFSSAGVNHR